jgi:hypothetical protein
LVLRTISGELLTTVRHVNPVDADNVVSKTASLINFPPFFEVAFRPEGRAAGARLSPADAAHALQAPSKRALRSDDFWTKFAPGPNPGQ